MGFVENVNKASLLDPVMLASLNADKATLDSLFADKATLDSLFADKAALDSLYADKVTLDSLYTDKAKLDSLYTDKTTLDSIYAVLAEIGAVGTDILKGKGTNTATDSAVLNALDNANIASTKAGEASSSASAAYTSEVNAKAFEINSSTSEINAANSAASVDANSIVHTEGSGLANELLTYLKTLDGEGSGLDADLLDGVDSSGFMVSNPGGEFSGDVNTLKRQGTYRVSSTATNAPTSAYYSFIVGGNNSDVVSQIATHYTSGKTYIRAFNTVWSTWTEVWTQGNDGAGSGLDADTVDGVEAALLGVGGAGYAWVDETANRVGGTTYTNTTGKPIIIAINGDADTADAILDIKVNGNKVVRAQARHTGSFEITSGLILVPDGSTYTTIEQVVSSGIYSWFELK